MNSSKKLEATCFHGAKRPNSPSLKLDGISSAEPLILARHRVFSAMRRFAQADRIGAFRLLLMEAEPRSRQRIARHGLSCVINLKESSYVSRRAGRRSCNTLATGPAVAGATPDRLHSSTSLLTLVAEGGGGGNNSGGGPAASGGATSGGHTNGGGPSRHATGQDNGGPKGYQADANPRGDNRLRPAIMNATMAEPLRVTTMSMIIVITAMDISFTVYGSGMDLPTLLTTAAGSGIAPSKQAAVIGGPATTTKKTRWSREATEHSDALDLEHGVFRLKNAKRIALSLKRSAEHSHRRKSDPYRSAMSMLSFYINRTGKNLSDADRHRLERAKDELRKLFHRFI